MAGRDEADHPVFVEELQKSNFAVALVAALLELRGYRNIKWSIATAGDTRASSVRNNFDHGDIHAISPTGERQIFEVKWLGYQFTGLRTWPFKREFFLFSKHAWERVKPRWFIALSPDLKHMAIVDCHDALHVWTEFRQSSRKFNDLTTHGYKIKPDEVTAWVPTPPELEPLRQKLITLDPRYLKPTA